MIFRHKRELMFICDKCRKKIYIVYGYVAMSMTPERIDGICKRIKWTDGAKFCPKCRPVVEASKEVSKADVARHESSVGRQKIPRCIT